MEYNEQEKELKKLISEYQYLAWVPCVVGRLDFSRISTDQLRCRLNSDFSDSVCFSYIDEHSISSIKSRVRYNIASSVFDWKDREDENEEYNGLFRFITIASSKDNAMEGVAYLVLHNDIVDSETFRNDILLPMMQLQSKVAEYEKALEHDQYTPSCILKTETVEKSVKGLQSSLDTYANRQMKGRIIKVKYKILHNGLVFLETESREGIDDEESNEINHHSYIAAKQTFIYLKYSLHNHKHHIKEEDRLTVAHRINPHKPEETAQRLIDDLRRSVIELKEREFRRIESPEHYLQGFISYSKSLIEALAETSLISNEVATVKKSYFDNMLQSWQSLAHRTEAQQSKELKENEDKLKGWGDFLQGVSVLIAVIALIFQGLKYIYSSDGVADKVAKTPFAFLNDYFSNPDKLIPIFVFLFFIVIFSLTVKEVINPLSPVRRAYSTMFNFLANYIHIYLTRITLSIGVAALTYLLGITLTIF